MKIDLTCVVPVYNGSQTIRDLLRSIEKHIGLCEVILVDDGSTDNTLAVIEDFKARSNLNIKVIKQANKKQSEARNNGLGHVVTKYVCFLDADDIVLNGFSELVDLSAELNGNCLLIGPIERIYSDIDKEVLLPKINDNDYQNLLKQYLICGNEADVGLWNKIFIMDLIKENQLHFENGNFFEDSLFVLKYIQAIDSIKLIQEPVYALNKQNESTTRKLDHSIVPLATAFLEKTDELIKNTFTIREKQAKDFRVELHIFHHFIKYGSKKDALTLGKKLKKKTELSTIKEKLATNYKLAVLLISLSPSLYRRLFLLKK